jgi:hypothetical protein
MAETGGPVCGLTGSASSLLYRLASYTGLRAQECCWPRLADLPGPGGQEQEPQKG